MTTTADPIKAPLTPYQQWLATVLMKAFGPFATTTVDRKLIHSWEFVFSQDVDRKVFHAALQRVCAEPGRKFAPTPGEVTQAMLELRSASPQQADRMNMTPEQAWEGVVRIYRELGDLTVKVRDRGDEWGWKPDARDRYWSAFKAFNLLAGKVALSLGYPTIWRAVKPHTYSAWTSPPSAEEIERVRKSFCIAYARAREAAIAKMNSEQRKALEELGALPQSTQAQQALDTAIKGLPNVTPIRKLR